MRVFEVVDRDWHFLGMNVEVKLVRGTKRKFSLFDGAVVGKSATSCTCLVSIDHNFQVMYLSVFLQ